MKNKNPYECFPNFVLRAPILSLDFYKSLTADSFISEDRLKQVCTDPIMREALFLASPSLFNEMDKWLKGAIENNKDIIRIKNSVLKYISRMCSRCTPFGLFAGCVVGKFSDKTSIKLDKHTSFKRHTRLDMNFLVSLSQNLAQRQEIRSQLKFYPNSSIYEVGHQLRYVEYRYIRNSRHHHIASVSNSEYINKILTQASKGASLENLAKLIIEPEISLEEAKDFVFQLVDNQILISELEPSVSGPEFLTQIINVLEKLSGVDSILKSIYQIRNLCDRLDEKIGNEISLYKDLTSCIETLDTEFENKYLFQTDLKLLAPENKIDKKVAYSLRRALTFLNKINPSRTNNPLAQFRQAFSKRYESKEMLLSKVLDLEIGIGYLQNQSSDAPDPILDNIILPQPKASIQEQEYKINSVHQIFQNLITNALQSSKMIISLDEKDFDFLDAKWDDTPDTFSFMIELVEIDGQEKIKMITNGGSSSANLLGRFCHGDKDILKHTQNMVNLEENINEGKIMAEIVHLPEARVGNVLMRPTFRKAEIPYLAKSLLPETQQIPLDDLMISVRQNRIHLRSKKHNLEVIPRLSNAHNYITNALPIYQFLGSMQTQNLRAGMTLDLGPLVQDFPFIPRIEFQNIILRSASWKIKKIAITDLLKSVNSNEKLEESVRSFCIKNNLPKLVLLIDGDNELLVNFSNMTSVRMWLSLVKKRSAFTLDEFLFGNDEVVKGGESNYNHTNQAIISFYHKERLLKKNAKNENSKNLYHW